MPGPRLAALAAVLLVAAPVGCKKASSAQPDVALADTAATDGKGRFGIPDAGPRLPSPHRLSPEPDAGAFVAHPSAALASLEAYVPQAPPLAAVAELILATQMPDELAAKIAPHIDGARPWAAVHVAGEDILQLPLRPGADVAAALQGLPTRGDFGAVELAAPAIATDPGGTAAPRLAWIDKHAGTLALARTLEGLSTTRLLSSTYGAHPLWGTLADARARAFVPEFPYARIAAVGQGLHELDVSALAAKGQALPVAKQLATGALTGMLAVPDLAAGVSTRWPGYKKAVQDVIREMNANVDRAGFAAKLMLDPLVDQAARALRRWNGRVLLAVGPARHVRLAFGADEPAGAFKDLAALLRSVIDNLSLARMFANVPGASLRQVADKPTQIYVLTVDGLARNLPAAAKPLLDDKGRLRVAFAASERAGGVQIVIGPDPAPVVEAWVGHAGESSPDDLIAGVLAVSPEHLQPLMQTSPQQSALLDQVLQLAADRPPTLLRVEQKPDRYHATVRGPDLKGRPHTQPQSQPQPATTTGPGKPARPAD